MKCSLITYLHHHVSPFWLRLAYFVSLSFIGFHLLTILPMRHSSDPRPSHLDLFFMSVSASTVSSMDTVEMESFSNSQLLVLTLLMLFGSEVFTSMLGLLFLNLNYKHIIHHNQQEMVELGMTPIIATKIAGHKRSSWYLWFVILGYLILVHGSGCAIIVTYFRLVPGARAILGQKGIRLDEFALFTAVSSFANCGFLPTNENMVLFRTYSGFLLTVSALVLLGNTMYPLALRAAVWGSRKTSRKEEFEVILSENNEPFLMSGYESVMLGATAVGLILVQVVLFCCLEWGSVVLDGMSAYQKVVGSLFMSINSRHAGESIIDLSAVSSAILVLYVVMMYLPGYTIFFPVEKTVNARKDEDEENNNKEKKKSFVRNLIFSQLAYLSIFIVIICITERRQISEDPLNFNALYIVFEVISAYGNVGFSTGYSCKRRLKDEKLCRDSMVGFSGRWSGKGKVTLAAVMVFGRLKNFNLNGRKAWMIR